MYQKRLKGYAAIGYKAKENTTPCSSDVQSAKSEIVIVSPFLTKRRVLLAMPYLKSATAKVTVFTKPLTNYNDKDKTKIEECVTLLTQNNITVNTKDRIHHKFAVMDQHIVWYGSINLLSYGTS